MSSSYSVIVVTRMSLLTALPIFTVASALVTLVIVSTMDLVASLMVSLVMVN